MKSNYKASFFFDEKDKLIIQKNLFKKNKSLKDIAQEYGCSNAYVSSVINGKKNLSKNFYSFLKQNGYLLGIKCKIDL